MADSVAAYFNPNVGFPRPNFKIHVMNSEMDFSTYENVATTECDIIVWSLPNQENDKENATIDDFRKKVANESGYLYKKNILGKYCILVKVSRDEHWNMQNPIIIAETNVISFKMAHTTRNCRHRIVIIDIAPLTDSVRTYEQNDLVFILTDKDRVCLNNMLTRFAMEGKVKQVRPSLYSSNTRVIVLDNANDCEYSAFFIEPLQLELLEHDKLERERREHAEKMRKPYRYRAPETVVHSIIVFHGQESYLN